LSETRKAFHARTWEESTMAKTLHQYPTFLFPVTLELCTSTALHIFMDNLLILPTSCGADMHRTQQRSMHGRTA